MRAAVLGRPIGHSLSPVLHTAAYAALGLTDWSYTAIDCGEAELPGLVAGLGPDWAGLSLTMPLKRAALAVAGSADPLAAAVGVANTLVLAGGERRAYLTDAAGIATALREAGLSGPESAVVLGAGGTAQAALAALCMLGLDEAVVLVRDPGRAGELRATADRLGVALDLRSGLPGPLPAADLVISTLPAGAADGLAPPAGAVLLYVVYAPWPTRFAAATAAAGGTVVSGLALLLHQAAAQVELMTGRPAPVPAMRAALDAAVRARSEKPPTPAGA